MRMHLYLSFCWLLLIGLALNSCNIFSDSGKQQGCLIQDGIASWYGEDYHGTETASGEIYDMESLTAAHKRLSFNTVVRVENLENGKSVTVRINNRGPFVEGRVIDLSRRAAREIDIITAGITEVELYLIEEGNAPPPDSLSCQ